MDDLTETGKRIRQLRLEKGWSQAQLGKEVGLNGRSVRDWELGTSLPSSKTRPSQILCKPPKQGVK